jgi:DNA polymerase-3 subunit alpha
MPWIGSNEENAVEMRQKFSSPRSHILVLAQTYQGLKNIFKITSEAYMNSFYKFPLIDFDLLAENKEGIIVSTACAGGELPKLLTAGEKVRADSFVKKYKETFGENFYIELMSINYPVQFELNPKLYAIAKEHDVKTIVTSDAHYLYPEDQKLHEAILMLQSKKTYTKTEDKEEGEEVDTEIENEETEEKFWEFSVNDLYLKTADDIMNAPYNSDPYIKDVMKECIKNNYELFLRIDNIELDTSIKLPKLFENSEKILYKKVADALVTKGLNKNQVYVKRCRQEYDTICKLGFVDYILILEDLYAWVTRTFGKYAAGPGRGSSAGSLVNYLLGITDIDPIKFELMFERFIDEGRKDLPDVDMDFEPRVKDAVKTYLTEKYGRSKVASIGTYLVSKVKTAIKDSAKIYNVNFEESNAVTSRLPHFLRGEEGRKLTIDDLSYEELCTMFPKVQEFLDKYPDVKKLFKRIKNSMKSNGMHAAGLVVSSVDLHEWIPLVRASKNIVTANTEGGDYHELSAQGFVKFDILGLNNLQVVNDAMSLIKKRHGMDINWDDIPYDAPEVYKLAKRTDTAGIFQLESRLAKQTMEMIQPDTFDDLSAINALIRPGPLEMGMHREFAKRKRDGKWDIHESYKHILSKTYGVLTYQEQFMRCFVELGEFTAVEVNRVRKDLSKKEASKKFEDMRIDRVMSWKEKFVNNAMKRMPEEEVLRLWDLIFSFSKYAFNKAHSDAYTITSFREFWLKAHYGLEFYCSLLNNTSRAKEDKYGSSTVGKYISHIMTSPVYYAEDDRFKIRRDVKVLHVDVNKSEINFEIEDDNNLRFGLSLIKGISDEAAAAIIENRPFSSIDDLINSENKYIKNKRVIVALIHSGALDSISERKNRSEMYNYFIKKRKYKDEESVLDLNSIIKNESESSNVSFTEISYFADIKKSIKTKKENVIVNDLDELEEEPQIHSLFRIKNITKKKTVKGKPYHIFEISDGITTLSRMYFWEKYAEAFEDSTKDGKTVYNNIYYGTISKNNNFAQVKNIKFVKEIKE